MWKKWRLTHQLSNPLKSLLLPKIINNNSHIKDILQENWVFGSPVDVLMLSNIYNGLVWGAGESEKIFLSENIWFKSSIYTKNFLENADLRNSWPYFCSTFLNWFFSEGDFYVKVEGHMIVFWSWNMRSWLHGGVFCRKYYSPTSFLFHNMNWWLIPIQVIGHVHLWYRN